MLREDPKQNKRDKSASRREEEVKEHSYKTTVLMAEV